MVNSRFSESIQEYNDLTKVNMQNPIMDGVGVIFLAILMVQYDYTH